MPRLRPRQKLHALGPSRSAAPVPAPAPEVFTFGDPLPVLDRHEVMGLFRSNFNGRWYEPPVSFDGLAKALTASPHHQSALAYKVNLLAGAFVPHPLLSRHDFKRLALDFLVFGNAFVEVRRSRLGSLMRLAPLLARWTRPTPARGAVLLTDGTEIEFEPGAVLHLLEPDISQEIYGLPCYLGALQSALLGEAATLFRRKYYVNGSHAGFILYLTDPAGNQQDIDELRAAMRASKGPGNFRNLFMYMPNGKKDGLQVIPISEVTAKDEFWNIKNVTRDDVLAAHRVPPQLLGIVPSNNGGFGSVAQAADVFFRHEIEPLQTTFLALNQGCGEEVVRFAPYQAMAV